MTNKLLFIYDNEDGKQGEYFKASYQNIIEQLNKIPYISIQSLNTEKCLINPIADYLPNLNDMPLIFVAYAHGKEDAIFIAEQSYINTTNAYFFANSLFYSCCCLTAKSLGKHLIHHNCSVFIGYNATISTAIPETEPIFQECENAFLVSFLTTTRTIQESLNFMYQKYTQMKHHLFEEYSSIASSILEDNERAFEILCNDDALQYTRQNFMNHQTIITNAHS